MQKGFTILEFLVVIAVIGILIALVLGGVGGARVKAKNDAQVASLNEVVLALENYRNVCFTYPNELDPTANNGCAGATNFGNFLSDIPTDVNYFGYRHSSISPTQNRCTNYHVWTTLSEINPTNSLFGNDTDGDTSNLSADWSPCISGTNGIDGDDNLLIYDFLR